MNLAYDGNTLTGPTGTPGVELPTNWIFAANSPAPGQLRLLAVDLTGEGQTFGSAVFMATFTIDADALAGDVAVPVALQEVRDDSNMELMLTVINGVVTVKPVGS